MAKYASSEATYEALIDAAGELAAEKGFANVSTRDIAQRAGTNVSSIHYHFGGKDQLFEAVLTRLMDHMKTIYSDVLKPCDGPLATPKEQAVAISRIIDSHTTCFFSKDAPWWYSKVIYQAMQYDDGLYQLVVKGFVDPLNDTVFSLLKKIRPGISLEDQTLFNLLSVCIFSAHSDYRLLILHSLGQDDYGDEYIERVKKLSKKVLLQALGLPVDNGGDNEKIS